ncbi:MAG: hypothetical protein ACLRVT_06390 [Oscillospiraceae bacterium]
MDNWKRKTRLMGIVIAVVCVAALGLSCLSIYSTYEMRRAATMIYDHPYTVSNEARAMRSRLLDMKTFLLDIVAEPSTDVQEVEELLNQRYALQHEAIGTISRQYLGPQEDTDRLSEAMQDLEQTQLNALQVILPMGRDDTAQYVEEYLYPKYDAVNELTTIINLPTAKFKPGTALRRSSCRT